jgi:hypothetical protein
MVTGFIGSYIMSYVTTYRVNRDVVKGIEAIFVLWVRKKELCR